MTQEEIRQWSMVNTKNQSIKKYQNSISTYKPGDKILVRDKVKIKYRQDGTKVLISV